MQVLTSVFSEAAKLIVGPVTTHSSVSVGASSVSTVSVIDKTFTVNLFVGSFSQIFFSAEASVPIFTFFSALIWIIFYFLVFFWFSWILFQFDQLVFVALPYWLLDYHLLRLQASLVKCPTLIFWDIQVSQDALISPIVLSTTTAIPLFGIFTHQAYISKLLGTFWVCWSIHNFLN